MTPEEIAAWRATREATLDLSCGLTVAVRKVALLDLAARGEIPVPLIAEVDAILTNGADWNTAKLPDSFAVIDLVVQTAVVAPRLATEPGPDVLGVQEIPAEDRLRIWTWAHQEASRLARFPERQKRGAAPTHAEPDVSDAAQRDSTH